MEFMAVLKALENSPKGQLKYETGWDESPNAITNLIAVVQEKEVDKPNREIVERAFTSFYEKDRRSFSPKASPTVRVSATRNRHSLPASSGISKGAKESTPVSPTLLSSFLSLEVGGSQRARQPRPVLSAKRNVFLQSEPRIEVQEVLDDSHSPDIGAKHPHEIDGNYRRLLLTPPTRSLHRKKSFEGGSPIFKPSPSFSSSTQTQTHSSATSDATNATPTRVAICNLKTKKYGIADDALHEHEEQLEEDLILESHVSPFNFIQSRLNEYEEEQQKKAIEVSQVRLTKYEESIRECDKRIVEAQAAFLRTKRSSEEAIKQSWIAKQQANLQELRSLQSIRQKNEDKLQLERKAAASAAEASRKAAQEAAQQEKLRIQKAKEEEQRQKDQANLEKERLLQQKAAEEKRFAEAQVAAEAEKKAAEQKKSQEVVPDLAGLILKEDLSTYARTTALLKQYEEPVAFIDGKDPASKAFYIGAVKCINTPLNALADTHEGDILAKVVHFSKLISGEPVSGGGSMTAMFTCNSMQNGQFFVKKTLAFRFVKKAEADVTRGKSTVQPLATVGVHLCRKFPDMAMLIQAYFYKLCPFLVPFSHPLGDKSIQEYAKELGHDLSGTETAVQQTFLERIKGYCTLYALMVLRFQTDGPFDAGDATSFFSIGGAWHILAATVKLEPQVDVTATVIHTLLDILDDTLHAIYKNQFVKLMRMLILYYLPKIRNITPAAKSGSVSRLQIYLEKKFRV